jgi:NAD(P)-dependent dehydrogenase (short-subunit alcohol dehydrogenase family)
MTGKTVLITGANKSIGYQTARQLGRLGYRIWLGSRDAARGALATEPYHRRVSMFGRLRST